MKEKRTILIGGQQGEGIASTGLIIMKALAGLGYFGYGERHFSSRIKGGNTHLLMTISTEPVHCISGDIDILLAFDEATIIKNISRMKSDSTLLVDDVVQFQDEQLPKKRICRLPMTTLAKEHGSPLMKNTCAIGHLGKLMNLNLKILERAVENTYRNKTSEMVDQNLTVLNRSYSADLHLTTDELELQPPIASDQPLMLLMGNDVIALGALMAGCRFMAAYPITPASDIMETMSLQLPKENGLMVQTEDESAAITMCIGASFAGVRSMTATSGPGLTLMMEGLALAGMTETPVVVVDAQRSGPSTGMPTRTEQSDLNTLYYAGHGEYSMIILTPSTIEECYYLTIDAFNLADQYQCPVVLMSDLNLSLSPQTIPAIPYHQVKIHRGKLLDKSTSSMDKNQHFCRYRLTEDGISCRSFPGMSGGIHHVSGLEHNEWGRPSDIAENRRKMMDKRKEKMQSLAVKPAVKIIRKGSKGLCLTFGSNWGILCEAVKSYQLSVDIARITRLRPLPVKELQRILLEYDHLLILEQNQNAQMTGIIRHEIGYSDKIMSLTRYDGESFKMSEIAESIERWCEEWK